MFSTLENLGAFSLIEKSLPLVEKLGLLSILEEAVDIEAGLIFTGANFLIASGPTLLVQRSKHISCILHILVLPGTPELPSCDAH